VQAAEQEGVSMLIAPILSAALAAASLTIPQPPPATAAVTPAPLASEKDVRALCDAAAPSERRSFDGDILQRGEAAARADADRETALAGRYRVTVPGESLRFAAYAPEDGILSLYRHVLPAAAGGAVRLRLEPDTGLPVEAPASAVRAILAAQQEKKLALEVTFALAEDACFHVPGASAYTVAAEPVAWRYVAGEKVLARGGEGADRPLVSAKEGAKPRVEIGTPVDARDEAALRGAVQKRSGDLERCYASALARDPWLDGAIVADLSDRARIAADSVGDAALASCARGVLASAGSAGYVPVRFVLEAPEAR
jgi:hypothetical protein